MKAFLILGRRHGILRATALVQQERVISEIVFNTSMTGYLEVSDRSILCGTGCCDDISADW